MYKRVSSESVCIRWATGGRGCLGGAASAGGRDVESFRLGCVREEGD